MSDYEASAKRHYMDGDRLAGAGRYDNASHLMGLAAECALKRAAGGFTEPKHQEIDGHLPTLKPRIRAILQRRNASGRLLQFVNGRAFEQWSINDRYESDGFVDATRYQATLTETQAAFVAAGLRYSSAAAATAAAEETSNV